MLFPASFLGFMSGLAFIVCAILYLVVKLIIKIIRMSRPAYNRPYYAPASECREWDERSEYGEQSEALVPSCMYINMF